jgi:hypothetical protein
MNRGRPAPRTIAPGLHDTRVTTASSRPHRAAAARHLPVDRRARASVRPGRFRSYAARYGARTINPGDPRTWPDPKLSAATPGSRSRAPAPQTRNQNGQFSRPRLDKKPGFGSFRPGRRRVPVGCGRPVLVAGRPFSCAGRVRLWPLHSHPAMGYGGRAGRDGDDRQGIACRLNAPGRGGGFPLPWLGRAGREDWSWRRPGTRVRGPIEVNLRSTRGPNSRSIWKRLLVSAGCEMPRASDALRKEGKKNGWTRAPGNLRRRYRPAYHFEQTS